MIIGDGMIAKAMEEIDSQSIIFFCSGVSNSQETSEKAFKREKDLLTTIIKKRKVYNLMRSGSSSSKMRKLIYFGSIDFYIKQSPYYYHKKSMERLVETYPHHLIIRAPQAVGPKGNRCNLTNFLANSILKEQPIKLYEAFRSLLDVADLREIVDYLISIGRSGEIDINYVELITVAEIVSILENALSKAATIKKPKMQYSKFLDIRYNTQEVQTILDELGIRKSGYNKKVIEKYYGN